MGTGLMVVYGVAIGGLLVRVVLANAWSERLMAIALMVFALDLARMAFVDTRCLQAARTQLRANGEDSSLLGGFRRMLVVTLGLELLGLLVSWRWVGFGIAVVMASQLVFNCFVRIALQPGTVPPVRPWPIAERVTVLIADAVAFGLAVVWIVGGRPLAISIALLAMVVIYLGIKYVLPAKSV